MKRKLFVLTALGLLIFFLFASCVTVNELGEYNLRGEPIAAHLRFPPEPEVDVSYNLSIDVDHPIATVVNVGANIAKAAAKNVADDRMGAALASVDLPATVLEEAFARCAGALGAVRIYENDSNIHSAGDARYVFDLDIQSYGIRADSPTASVRFHMSVIASILDQRDKVTIWRRSISVFEAASPVWFGLPFDAGSVLSAAALADMDEEAIRLGFGQLVIEIADAIADRLEDDLYKANYR